MSQKIPLQSFHAVITFIWLLLVAPTTALAAGPFHLRHTYNVGVEPQEVVLADFNHDGKLDMATADFTSQDISILLGKGDGTFEAPRKFSTTLAPAALTVGDFNRDGHLDLAVSEYGFQVQPILQIFFGKGDGTFEAGPVYQLAGLSYDIAAADLSSNDILDLVVADNTANVVSVYKGKGDGTFAVPVNYASPLAERVLPVDLNGDGRPDLAVLDYCGTDVTTCAHGAVQVLLNEGNGKFGKPHYFAVNVGPDGIAAGDLKHNGKVDLVVSNNNFQAPSTLSILFGKGDGTFEPEVSYKVGAGPAGVVIADLNGDGKLDIAVANIGDATMSLLFGNGKGEFKVAQTFAFAANSAPISIAAIPVPSKRIPELAVVLDYANKVAILQHTMCSGMSMSQQQ